MTHAACLPLFFQSIYKEKIFPLFENTCAAKTEKWRNVHDKLNDHQDTGMGLLVKSVQASHSIHYIWAVSFAALIDFLTQLSLKNKKSVRLHPI